VIFGETSQGGTFSLRGCTPAKKYQPLHLHLNCDPKRNQKYRHLASRAAPAEALAPFVCVVCMLSSALPGKAWRRTAGSTTPKPRHRNAQCYLCGPRGGGAFSRTTTPTEPQVLTRVVTGHQLLAVIVLSKEWMQGGGILQPYSYFQPQTPGKPHNRTPRTATRPTVLTRDPLGFQGPNQRQFPTDRNERQTPT